MQGERSEWSGGEEASNEIEGRLAITAVNRNEVLKKERGGKEMPKRMSCIKE